MVAATWFILLACQTEPVDGSTSPGTTPSTVTSSTDTSTPSVTTSVPTTTERYDYSRGIELIDTDTERYDEIDGLVETYAITSDFEVPLTFPNGGTPTFHVIRPAVDPTSPVPAVLVLHPGVVDIDTEEEPDGENGRCANDFGPDRADHYLDTSVFTPLVLAQGGVVVVPVNSFCDLYLGDGPEDANDPRHGGAIEAEIAFDWLRYGQDEIPIDEENLSVLGARFPSVGASAYTATHPEIDLLLFVGAPGDLVRYHDEKGYCQWPFSQCQAWMVHILGGPPFDDAGATPSEWYPLYRDASIVHALPDGRYLLPILHIYNQHDLVSPIIQHREVTTTLREVLDPAGVRWSEYDVANIDATHDQVHNAAPSGVIAWWFMQGFHIYPMEAEMPSAAGDVGTSGPNKENLEASGAAVRIAEPEDGAGVLFQGGPGMNGRAGESVRVGFILDMNSKSTETAVTLELLEDGEAIATRELAPADIRSTDIPNKITAYVGNIEASTLEAVSSGGEISARVWVSGTSWVELDLVVFGL